MARVTKRVCRECCAVNVTAVYLYLREGYIPSGLGYKALNLKGVVLHH